METIKNIGVHHFAGNLTLPQLNASHKARWPDLPSELRPDLWVGYNFVIWKDGTWTQTRYIGEETAAQVGHNFDTVSMCMAGNFTAGIELPTEAQKKTLKWLILSVQQGNPVSVGLAVKQGTVLQIDPKNVFPHRVLQPNHTECYGSALSDDWAEKLAFPDVVVPPPVTHATDPVSPQSAPTGEKVNLMIAIIRQLIALYQELAKKQQGLGGLHTCQDSDVRG